MSTHLGTFRAWARLTRCPPREAATVPRGAPQQGHWVQASKSVWKAVPISATMSLAVVARPCLRKAW